MVATLAACGGNGAAPGAQGRVVVAITVDWEGAYLSPDGLAALDALRGRLGDVPLTHFVSAAYFAKPEPDAALISTLTERVRKGDELAVHLHGWTSLASVAKVEPRLAPSFLTGTDKVISLDDGDAGFDLDLDAYTVADLRALVRTSRKMLETTRLPVSTSFRAGGYLATPKVLRAIRDEGFTVDSSAIDARQLDEAGDVLVARVRGIWPSVDTASQPFYAQVPGPPLLEMPAAAFADYASADEIATIIDAAHARLQKDPRRDVFVVLGLHQETGDEFAPRIGDAIESVRKRRNIASDLVFTTVEYAAAIAQSSLDAHPN